MLLLSSYYNKQEYEQRSTFTSETVFLFSAAFLSTATDTEMDDKGDDDLGSMENVSDSEEEELQGSEIEDLAVTSKFNYLMTKEELESVNADYIEGHKAGDLMKIDLFFIWEWDTFKITLIILMRLLLFEQGTIKVMKLFIHPHAHYVLRMSLSPPPYIPTPHTRPGSSTIGSPPPTPRSSTARQGRGRSRCQYPPPGRRGRGRPRAGGW